MHPLIPKILYNEANSKTRYTPLRIFFEVDNLRVDISG